MSDRDLVEALASLQRANSWTDDEVARRLGVSRSTWSLLRRGRRRPGTRVLGGMHRAFPDLHRAIALFLQYDVTRHTKSGRSGTAGAGAAVVVGGAA